MRPDLLLAGDLAGGDLVEQLLGAVGHLVGVNVGTRAPGRRSVAGVGDQVVGDSRRAAGRSRVVGRRRPQVLLERCQPVHSLARLEVGLADVDLRVEVAEGLGDRLDALPVDARLGVERARAVVVARP